jgi:D-methionine transport system ATP-binding protein
MPDSHIIEFKAVEKTFLTTEHSNLVLANVNLKVPQGKIFGVIGYSGAGKSTLIRCINGLEKPTAGRVLFKDSVINQLSPSQLLQLRSDISMIFQQFNLMPQRTIFENVSLPIKYQHLPVQEVQQKVQRLLDLVGLSDKAQAYPASLSGGQQQRVAIARALINDPQVLLCDEATSALDPETTNSILDILKRLNRKLGLTIIIVTHEMEVIQSICDEVAVLDYGHIVEHGNVYDVFSNPQHALTQKFVKTTTNLSVSPHLAQNLGLDPQRLFKIQYQRNTIIEPIISEVIKRCQVDISVVLGDIKVIQDQLLGGLVVSIEGDLEQVKKAYAYLKTFDNVKVEVLSDVE